MANANTENEFEIIALIDEVEITLVCDKGHSQDEIVVNANAVQHEDGRIFLGEFYYSSGWHFCEGCEADNEEDASRSAASVTNGHDLLFDLLGFVRN
jgi:hypothetical protein